MGRSNWDYILRGMVQGATESINDFEQNQSRKEQEYSKWNIDRLSYRDKLVENGYSEEEANNLTYETYGAKERPYSRTQKGYEGNIFGERFKKADYLPPSPGIVGEPVISASQALAQGKVKKGTKILSDRYMDRSNVPESMGEWKNPDLLNYIGKMQTQLSSYDISEEDKATLRANIKIAQNELSRRLGTKTKEEFNPVTGKPGYFDQNDPNVIRGGESVKTPKRKKFYSKIEKKYYYRNSDGSYDWIN